jgi:hypothetical protein
MEIWAVVDLDGTPIHPTPLFALEPSPPWVASISGTATAAGRREILGAAGKLRIQQLSSLQRRQNGLCRASLGSLSVPCGGLPVPLSNCGNGLGGVKKPGCLLGAEFVLSARTNRLRSLQSSGAHQLIQNYCGRGPRLFTLASLHQSTSGSDLRQEQAQDADHLGFAPEMVTVLTTASLLPWPHQSEAAPLIVCRAGRVLRSNVLMQPLKCVFGSGEQLKMRPPRSAVDSSAYVGRIRNSPLKSQLPISALLYEIRSPVAY